MSCRSGSSGASARDNVRTVSPRCSSSSAIARPVNEKAPVTAADTREAVPGASDFKLGRGVLGARAEVTSIGRMSDATDYLRALSESLVDAYAADGEPRAVLLGGSAATGTADAFSDLDLFFYYDEPLPEEVLVEAQRQAAGIRYRRWRDDDGEWHERFFLNGVECQAAHVPVAVVAEQIRSVTVDLDLSEPLLKVMSGLFEGVPLRGSALIDRWRREAAMPDKVQRALVEKRWQFFPWWYFQERMRARDSDLWRYDVLVQSAYSLLGVLAALNRLYFSRSEFKRTRRLISRLELAPSDFANRLDRLFLADEPESTDTLERLVGEVGELVEQELPGFDLAITCGEHETPPGSREQAWRIPS